MKSLLPSFCFFFYALFFSLCVDPPTAVPGLNPFPLPPRCHYRMPAPFSPFRIFLLLETRVKLFFNRQAKYARTLPFPPGGGGGGGGDPFFSPFRHPPIFNHGFTALFFRSAEAPEEHSFIFSPKKNIPSPFSPSTSGKL